MKLHVYNWTLPRIVKFRPNNPLFKTVKKPKITVMVQVAGRMAYFKNASPEQIEVLPITSLCVMKAPLGWRFELEEVL